MCVTQHTSLSQWNTTLKTKKKDPNTSSYFARVCTNGSCCSAECYLLMCARCCTMNFHYFAHLNGGAYLPLLMRIKNVLSCCCRANANRFSPSLSTLFITVTIYGDVCTAYVWCTYDKFTVHKDLKTITAQVFLFTKRFFFAFLETLWSKQKCTQCSKST